VVGFNTVADGKTEVVYIETTEPSALKTDGTPANSAQADQGSVTIVGQNAMLEAQLSGGERNLVVFGPLGATFQVETSNNLGDPSSWVETTTSFTMTNLSQTLQLPPDTNSATFYRTMRVQ
jgi:hypothetical protein